MRRAARGWIGAAGVALALAGAACSRSHNLGTVDPDADEAGTVIRTPGSGEISGEGGLPPWGGDDAAVTSDGGGDAGGGDTRIGGGDASDGGATDDGPAPPTRAAGACYPTCAGLCIMGTCRDGVSRWTTLGGDHHRSGVNVNETGRPPLREAWGVDLGDQPLGQPVSDGQSVFVTTTEFGGVFARAASDGHELWRGPMDLHAWGGATLADGHLYVTQWSGTGSTQLVFAFESATGKTLWSAPGPNVAWSFGPPLLVGTRMFWSAANGMDLFAMQTSDGAPLFATAFDSRFINVSGSTFLDGDVYAYGSRELYAHDVTTGKESYHGRIPLGDGVPVTDGEKIYLVMPDALRAYRPHVDEPVWTVPGAYSGMPAAAAYDTVYAIESGHLIAHGTLSGVKFWTFDGDGKLEHGPAVAGDWVYVGSATDTWAVHKDTHEIGWHAYGGGRIAIAGGRVFLARADGFLLAYTLTR